ncbi:DNA polymerase III, beta subunit [Malaciobacter marinus]|uniref:Beta sliding clamp n=1 Tax=Malaciobacter marinus TaxID=505249 RepID=A0A347TGS6_9BACT|nr:MULTISPECIES: DNA polymerase III subunit beta [Malaciobacter]AXX85804.1 DNA polymerase III, beta subunit [Malaciobacter marinus]PHO15798.1 DNA polymerase III subunit beta [Malaciobacter marinus]PPK62701.1 DNA polymerase-3 subunit beta [Malaciobacter marinus]RYA23028.1 DNA polymerase III subunit beta [Malaciobacter halophilus]
MKFIITKNIIENIVSSMQPFLEKKDASAITSHIYLEVNNDKLIIKATDYEIGLESQIEELNESLNGKATVNGSNLLGILKRLKDLEIIVETIENNLIIRQNKSTFKLPMYDPNEYPSLPKPDNINKLDISMLNLINSIRKITPAIDNNNPKFELNGALVDIKSDKINFVATDTRRLAVSHLQNISNDQNQFIIPKKAIIEIQKLFLDDATVAYDSTNLIISNERMTFFTKLINGKFPDYDRIIPNSLKYNFSLPKDMLIESIKLVTSLFSNIKITFSSNTIVFESLDEDSESKTQIDIDLNIEDTFYLAVNAKYLLDFLSLTNNENVNIGFNESNLPFYLEDEKFFTIVMPIVLEK